jgi:Protein of unknown function (DUF2809)
MTFRVGYFALAVALFGVEVVIALFAKGFIRFSFGDFLVVILMYCLARTFLKGPVLRTAIGVLLFAYAVEGSQYFHLINRLGLERSLAARLILGNLFEWGDMVAYTLGITLVLGVEWARGALRN